MISRVMDGFDGIFFDSDRESAVESERDARVFDSRGSEGTGADGVCWTTADVEVGCSSLVIAMRFDLCTGTDASFCIPEGSKDGVPETVLGFNGVRKGDLNGFWSVFAASFSRRRLACGVDIFVGT